MQDYGRGLRHRAGNLRQGLRAEPLPARPLRARARTPDIGQLTVTIGMYYRVTGESTQNRGVQPDLQLPSAISVEDVGESSRDGALPWNRIRPAPFKREGVADAAPRRAAAYARPTDRRATRISGTQLRRSPRSRNCATRSRSR